MKYEVVSLRTITKRYVAEGFPEDLHDFLKQFIEEGHYTLPDFITLWKKKRMSLLYMGRTSTRELYEFTQECFSVVLSIVRCEDSELLMKTGAMYFLYCLYRSQPHEKYRIRITLDDNRRLFALFELAQREKLVTLAFAILNLKLESAFAIVGMITVAGCKCLNGGQR